MIMSEDKTITVEASWHNPEPTDYELVRMEWKVTNETNSVVIINGYRITKDVLDVVIEQIEREKYPDHTYEVNEPYQSNSHILTVLWPEESRTYTWAFVHPHYYRFYRRGNWGYYVKIRYQNVNTNSLSYAVSNIAPLHLKKKPKGRLLSATYYRLLKDSIYTLLKQLEPQKIVPHFESYEERMNYKIGHIGTIDTLLLADEVAIIVEYVPAATSQRMDQAIRFMEWVYLVLGKKPIGLLITESKQLEMTARTMPSNYKLVVAFNQDGKLEPLVF